MDEKTIEHRLVEAVERAGGMALKFVSPSCNGMPDRLVLLKGGRMAFVEVKRPGEKPRKLQVRRHVQLRNLGFKVFVLDDPAQIPDIVKEISDERAG